jgi:hypothetical protein
MEAQDRRRRGREEEEEEPEDLGDSLDSRKRLRIEEGGPFGWDLWGIMAMSTMANQQRQRCQW